MVDPDARARPSGSKGATDRPWYANMWDGVDSADRTKAP